MGNICRSPTAEGVFRKFIADSGLDSQVHSDSAGTHAYHVGEKPDQRACASAARRGYSLEEIRARRVSDMDFEGFDLILAMDRDNLELLREYSDERHHGKIGLLLDYSVSAKGQEVPDPYYGGPTGFERVLDLVEDAAAGLLDAVRQRL